MGGKPWTDDEIKYLISGYDCDKKEVMMERLQRSWRSISTQAGRSKVSRNAELDYTSRRKSDISILLDYSLETCYWLGFILADGHLSNNTRVCITLAICDLKHLQKFGRYIKCKVFEVQDKCHVRAQHKDVVPIFANRYDLVSNKTKYPPRIKDYKLNDEQFLSLVIGYIDGDGCIYATDDYPKIKVACDASWLDNLKYLNERVANIFQMITNHVPHLTGNGKALWVISNTRIVECLSSFVRNHPLPFLERKWDKLLIQLPRRRTVTGERFITMTKYNNYRVRFYINRKKIDIGTFSSLQEAIVARDNAEPIYYGNRLYEGGSRAARLSH